MAIFVKVPIPYTSGYCNGNYSNVYFNKVYASVHACIVRRQYVGVKWRLLHNGCFFDFVIAQAIMLTEKGWFPNTMLKF